MTDKKPPRGNKAASTSRPVRKKTDSNTGFSQSAKPVRKGYSSTTGDAKPKKKTTSDIGFSQKAKTTRKGYSSTSDEQAAKPKFKKANAETGFSQRAKPEKKGYSSTYGDKPKKKMSDTGFSQRAKTDRKGYSSASGEGYPKKTFSKTGYPKKDKPVSGEKTDNTDTKPRRVYKKNSGETGFSQKAKPEKKGYYTQAEKPVFRKKRTDDNTPVDEKPTFRKKINTETTPVEEKFAFRKKRTGDEATSGERPSFKRKTTEKTEDRESSRFIKKPVKTPEETPEPKKFTGRGKKSFEKTIPVPEYNLDKYEKRKRTRKDAEGDTANSLIRLNRYIANSGICSRRDADLLIQSGEIKINGNIVTELGYKVKPSDTVKYGNRTLNREKMVYVLLNKPKDFITTMDDPDERRTVMELVKDACPQRIYPVGRLDRNTTGLLLLTNDGELAEKLTHPSNEVKKLYEVELNKPIEKEHFEAILQGVELEDGKAEVDEIATVNPDKTTLGIQIHNGRNRIVRRIFEHFGYDVVRLDRVIYAGLTKKDLPRGNWRFLTEREVITLKFLL